MKLLSSIVWFAPILSFLLHAAVGSEYTVEIPAGTTDCFYQYIKRDTPFEVDYQVLDGGELDIGFAAYAPSGQSLVVDMKRSDAQHKFKAIMDGDHRFCFDNSFSHFTKKLVYFDIVTEESGDEKQDWFPNTVVLDSLETYDVQIETFRERFTRIKSYMDQSVDHQNAFRIHESLDRKTQESNFERVNFWSTFQLVIMVTTAVVQVVTIRGLFNDQSRINKLLKRATRD